MNILQFIRLILRNITIVTLVPLIMGITIFLGTINSPDNYKSSTTIYTGFASGYSIENGEKAKIKLAKAHEKINNIKLNYIHNITTQLVRENQTIGIEDLNVLGMLKNQNLSKSISELSIGETFRQLKYKCEWYERNLVQIDRWFPSSKKCSKCGYKYQNLSLNERTWICPECGEKHNRDFNASTNIEDETRRILGIRCPEFTLVDYPTMDDKLRDEALKSSGRVKQEIKC